ncbi:hypothetical protein [Streptomyces sp. cg35]|uniref:hypothetical protein n=1 Tax=Streptomyces sp. cg35 TaxID=3421650 RepID=UPI003D18473E
MAGQHRKSLVGDIALAVFVLFVDALAYAVTTIWQFAAHVRPAQEAWSWTYLGLAVLIAASAFAFGGRAGLPVTAGAQLLAGAFLGLAALARLASA